MPLYHTFIVTSHKTAIFIITAIRTSTLKSIRADVHKYPVPGCHGVKMLYGGT
jgi:hypothetical protein